MPNLDRRNSHVRCSAQVFGPAEIAQLGLDTASLEPAASLTPDQVKEELCAEHAALDLLASRFRQSLAHALAFEAKFGSQLDSVEPVAFEYTTGEKVSAKPTAESEDEADGSDADDDSSGAEDEAENASSGADERQPPDMSFDARLEGLSALLDGLVREGEAPSDGSGSDEEPADGHGRTPGASETHPTLFSAQLGKVHTLGFPLDFSKRSDFERLQYLLLHMTGMPPYDNGRFDAEGAAEGEAGSGVNTGGDLMRALGLICGGDGAPVDAASSSRDKRPDSPLAQHITWVEGPFHYMTHFVNKLFARHWLALKPFFSRWRTTEGQQN